MSFGGMILTNAGRNELIRAEMGECFKITHFVLGDGKYNGAYTAVTGLVNQVMEIPVAGISRTEEGVLVEFDFNSKDAPRAFYFREMGIVANGVLCYYDNAREDAEYIDPASDVLVKQKRMRFVLTISSDIEVNIRIESSLYALAEDLESILNPEYEEPDSLEAPQDRESIFGILGKVKRSIKDLIAHIGDRENPHGTDKEQVGLGNADNTADIDKPVSTAQQAAIDAVKKLLDDAIKSHTEDMDDPHGVTKAQVGLGNADNTADINKPVSIAQQAALDDIYQQLTAYTNQKIAGLINGAPSTLDTLKEVADAISAHKTIMDALDAAIGKKASAAEFDSHTKDTTKHVTAAERTSWNGKLAPTGDASNVTATFSQASTRANISSKESLKTSMGKIMKWFSDLANGAASTLLGSNLTANRALVANANGKVAVSAVTSTELGYLDGVTSGIQGQLDQLNTHIQVLGEHVYLAASNKKDWVWVNVPDLNAFRYILLCRTTLNGSSRGCNITTLNLFRSLNNSSLTFSVDDTDTTLACYSSDTKVGLYSSRDDRQTMLFGIR